MMLSDQTIDFRMKEKDWSNNNSTTRKEKGWNIEEEKKELESNVETKLNERDTRPKELSLEHDRLPPALFSTPILQNSFDSGFVQCCITRDMKNSKSRFQSRFNFVFEMGQKESIAMIAQKTMTSSYQIFDTSSVNERYTRKLNKKAGHFIGKLSRQKKNSIYALYDNKEEKEQLAAFVYDIPSLMTQWKEGQPPRKLQICLPSVGKDGRVEPRGRYMKNRLIDCIEKNNALDAGLVLLHTKDPTFEGGRYRLNFSGRVSIPSIKNMQLILNDKIIAQFGKVGEHKFHLDYKPPFNALQAFALALTALDI